MVVRVGFGNNKGGTGKTSTVVGLAGALAEKGKRVLLIDMDPQANLTRRLGFEENSETVDLPTISEVIKADREGCAADAILECGWDSSIAENIDFIPSRFDLENRISEAGTVGALRRLDRALRGVDDEYDFTLFDFPPSLGHLTQLGFVAAQRVVIVLNPEYDGVQGAIRVRDFIAAHGADLGVQDLKMAGVIVNLARAHTGLHAYHLEGLNDNFPGLVWEPSIPQRTVIAEANDAASPISNYPGAPAKELTEIYTSLVTKLENVR